MADEVVRFNHVSKRFRLGQTQDSLRDLIGDGVRRLFHKHPRRGKSMFWALSDVDFAVSRGEAVGIIGPNGAGKSTVLRLLAGILRPDKGRVTVDGRLAALIEIGAGFHGDLTGRENIFLNGAILGMSRAEILRKLDAIVSFAGLERFLDMPVKRYSSGMYARLGFSVASHVEPQVLLVDEVLSVGDAVFRLRCLDRMHGLVRDGTTLVFVTHNLEQMQEICRRAIVLDGGKVSFHGPPPEAVGHYLRAMSRVYADRPADLVEDGNGGAESVELQSFRLLNSSGDEVAWIRPSDEVRIELTFRLTRAIPRLIVETNLRAPANNVHISLNSGRDATTFPGEVGLHRVTLSLAEIPLAGGQYFWNVRMWDADSGTNELDTPFRYPMVINDDGKATGAVCLDHDWSFESCVGRILIHQPAGGDGPPSVASRLEECGSRS